MPSSLPERFHATPRKCLTMRGESVSQATCEDEKRQLGRAIERALNACGLTKQEAAFKMGYPDQSAISRWIAGTETPQIAKLHHALGLRFRRALILALSEGCEGVTVETTIKVSA